MLSIPLVYISMDDVCPTYRNLSKCFLRESSNFTATIVPLTEFYSKDLGEHENSPRFTARGGRKRRLASEAEGSSRFLEH